MDDCIFCKIVKGDIPCFKIYENDEYLAFLDISHFVDGHTLVIPKKHFRFFWEVEDIEGYFKFVSDICNHFTKNLGFKYVDTLTFGRLVPHAHVHLIPHNGDNEEWREALNGIGEMQKDESRRLTKEKGEELSKKFSLNQ